MGEKRGRWDGKRRNALARLAGTQAEPPGGYDVRQAASLKAGGCGMRYTCRVRNRVVDLFCEDGRWFLDLSRRAQ